MTTCDTSALSHFFRRQSGLDNKACEVVQSLIESGDLVLLGIVKQELLSGIKHKEQFDKIREVTQAFSTFFAEEEDHILAAQFFNACRAKGIQGSPVDFLICAMSARRKFSIYTTDPDFALYGKIIPIDLY